MSMSTRRAGHALLLLFVLSGFSGLVYQSVWSHYLGLTLGHAAYAQSLVLAIYMGGMALGAWGASRLSLRWNHLILAYAAIEVLIGVAGLAFHPLFIAYLDVSTGAVLPALGSPGAAHAWQWLSAGLLIAPQCVLLGATFPLLSAGYMRLERGQDGPILGGLYFSNSLGAAAGALVAAFALLPRFGMPGAMVFAGVANLIVGLGAWWVWREAGARSGAAAVAPSATAPTADVPRAFVWLMLGAAAITGATSFVYEIGWVRLLNQALGTTVHAFELMLAAFIAGLAFGGLWVRWRSARAAVDPVAMAGHAQVLMGIAALLSIPVFNQSFRWVGWLLQHLSRDDAGYAWFSAGSGVIAIAVMFPAAFFAGMTLPLFTLALLRRSAGEASIGRVYAANTLGAIVGVFAMVHLLVPLMGVRLAITLAAAADIGLGLYLLRRVSPGRATRAYALAGLGAVAALSASLTLGRTDPHAQTAGVFRTGEWRRDADVRIPFLRDGKTATVSVSTNASGLVGDIATNGKPDASLTSHLDLPPTPDEVTMLMAGALPLVQHPRPARIAVIGWGSGLTTHTLLGSPKVARVDNVEIERAMYDGARLFGDRVARAYTDPRSRLRIDDARTYFATGHRRYDVIVSEPSNPWVSGVASLFTREFYGFVRLHLNEGGQLIQWVQTYEINDGLLSTMVAALLEEFPDTEVYTTNGSDLLLVARRDAGAHQDWSVLEREPLRSELRRVGLGSPAEFALRRIGGGATLRNFVRMHAATPHSDYYPVVTLNAPRARFKRELAGSLVSLLINGMPVQDVLGEGTPQGAGVRLADIDYNPAAQAHHSARAVLTSLHTGVVHPRLRAKEPDVADSVAALLALSRDGIATKELVNWSEALAGTSESITGLLPAADLPGVFDAPAWLPTDAPRDPAVQLLLDMHATAARRDPKMMLATAQAVLELPASTLAVRAREQALVIGMLGAIGIGQPRQAVALERKVGAGIRPSLRFGPVRTWLLAWADGADGGD